MYIHETPAMYAYYLGDDGATYELDMDSTRGAAVMTNPSSIREVYAEAIRQHPELAALSAIEIVHRCAPDEALLDGFHRGVHTWNEATEPRETAIARYIEHFATRLGELGPEYVYQPLPWGAGYMTLHVVGDEPERSLELHVRKDGHTTIEALHRGSRASVIAFLRSAAFVDTLVAVEQMILAARSPS